MNCPRHLAGAQASLRVFGGLPLLWVALAVVWSQTTGAGWAQSLRDNFGDRQILTAVAGSLDANNSAATVEPGEPRHGGKPGGKSLWISWLAPTNGVLKLETGGSGFDTLLSAYYFPDSTNTSFADLVELARADDSEGFGFESEVRLGVIAGQRYEIAMDGYYGASGNLEFNWDFEPTTVPPPVVISVPGDRASNLGETVILTLNVANIANGTYRWYHNGQELDEFDPTLIIPSMQPADVGRYKLKVFIDGPSYYSVPIELQINTDGAAEALAQDKVLDSAGSGLLPGGGGGGLLRAAAAGVTRGYNGSQVFNTLYASSDPNEPQHCGLIGGASYWYAYTAPADGTLILDTIGSSFDTFIAVYAFAPPLTSYADLVAIACDNDGASSNGAARLEFAAPRNRSFVVVVDGINGVRGLARLNYLLDTNRLPSAPVLVAPQSSLVGAVGASIAMEAAVTGSAPVRFQWSKGGASIAGATNHVLMLSGLTPAHAGEYSVTASNHVGGPLVVPMLLRVLLPPQLRVEASNSGDFVWSFFGVPRQGYSVEEAEDPGGPWRGASNIISGNDSLITVTNPPGGTARFFRLRVH